MKVLSEEKTRALAAKNGWSLARTEGYLDGETFRRRSLPPSKHVQVGLDEYSQGFRAGYYERESPDRVRSGRPDAPQKWRRHAV
jgi:hypothetical protein